MTTRTVRKTLCVAAVTAGWSLAGPGTSPVRAQDASRAAEETLPELPGLGATPGAFDSTLGPSPGSPQPSPFGVPDSAVVTGRKRGLVRPPRAGARSHHGGTPGVGNFASRALPLPGLPSGTGASRSAAVAGPLPSVVEDEGPPDGLTLDAAIARLLAANLDLAALKFELPQADADTLTAGLRANPVVYLDTQFIPYGSYTPARPGGPTQYDLNLAIPLDLSGKRQARLTAARAARCVLEAQFQDAARRQIAALCRAFVDLQAARVNALGAEAAWRELGQFVARQRQAGGPSGSAEIARLESELDKARGTLDEALDTLGDAREALGLLLNLPPAQATALEVRGSLRDRAPEPPPLDALIGLAIAHRPDLAAARLGLGRAEAEVRLARANRFDDVYFFYDPITYQDNRPSHQPSAHSWDVGLVVPLPLFNRNQGNIARARHNATQTDAERGALSRRVVSEVRLAHREYQSSRAAVARAERSVLPHARAARDKANAEFAAGTLSAEDYMDQLETDGETARSYRDAVLRHRRAMLDLNTAVALRLLP